MIVRAFRSTGHELGESPAIRGTRNGYGDIPDEAPARAGASSCSWCTTYLSSLPDQRFADEPINWSYASGDA
jgi:hypothetical protein